MRRVDFIVGARDFKSLRAEQLMQSSVRAYGFHDAADRLALVMTVEEYGDVPILDKEGVVKGIVTEFDLLKAITEDRPLADIKAIDIMTPTPVTVGPETPAEQIVRLMADKHLIRLPVVDEAGKLVGIVARRDILVGYLKVTSPLRGF